MTIYVWGTGCGAGDLMDTMLSPQKVAAFVEDPVRNKSFLECPVISPEELAEREADLILVTIRDADGVERCCRKLGIDTGKLFFLKNDAILSSRSGAAEAARAVLGKEYVEKLCLDQRLIRRPLWTERETLSEKDLSGDYVRLKTLEMLCGLIEKIPGAAAELGVYRGVFAGCMNRLLPNRKLYLFDTFEGFDGQESAGEGRGFTEAHRNTTEELVFAAMPFPKQVELRRGLFPQTAEGLEEERFSLVSLDVDLEESTLAGLRYFVPRLSPGGYLLLHDCFSPKLPGVRKALRCFEEENEQRLHKVPVCDINGTMIISA